MQRARQKQSPDTMSFDGQAHHSGAETLASPGSRAGVMAGINGRRGAYHELWYFRPVA